MRDLVTCGPILAIALTLATSCAVAHAADPEALRYCNPLPIPLGTGASASGDVTVIKHAGTYYMFCTGGGAWVSQDMLHWT